MDGDSLQQRSYQKAPCSLPLQDPVGTQGKVSPGFIGNYIHNFNILSWHKKQRPSKQARKRAREKAGKRITSGGGGGGQEEGGRGRQQSESGYDTTTVGEQSASSPQSSLSSSASNSSSSSSSLDAGSSANPRPALPTPNTPSYSSSISSPSVDSALKRLVKDLHRCDVFIARSQTALQQHCEAGERELKQVFTTLHQHLNNREYDLLQELHAIRETAGSILERRKATLSYLKSAASTSSLLDQSQVAELAQQMKQFVTDRKVDEEIGAVERFHGDVDDMLPHIMGFGQVNNVRHLYTEWEENPDKIILRSKSSTTFLPLSSTTYTLGLSEETTPPSTAPRGPSYPEGEYCSLEAEPQAGETASAGESADSAGSGRGQGACQSSSEDKHADSVLIMPMRESSSSGGSSHEDDITTTTNTTAPSRPVSHGNHYHKHKSSHSRFGKKQHYYHHHHHHQQQLTALDKMERDKEKMKYSPEQLKVIQDRVKDSLKNQGVYLYDPITGAGPPKEQSLEDGHGEAKEKREGWEAGRKKKTPTQLRRERKKRQRERERRQREMDKTASEESDEHTISPPPPPQTTPTPATPPLTAKTASEESDEHTISPPPPPQTTPTPAMPPLTVKIASEEPDEHTISPEHNQTTPTSATPPPPPSPLTPNDELPFKPEDPTPPQSKDSTHQSDEPQDSTHQLGDQDHTHPLIESQDSTHQSANDHTQSGEPKDHAHPSNNDLPQSDGEPEDHAHPSAEPEDSAPHSPPQATPHSVESLASLASKVAKQV